MAAAFITSLFSCPDVPPPSSNVTSSGAPVPSPKLPNFIAYALHRTRLAPCVTFAALFLLQRLKNKFPAARGSSGHRLFISAFMIASKIVCDDTYSNKSWAVVGQGMFQLKEINQMEREMCGYLEWQLNIDYLQLEEFTEDVSSRFGAGSLSTTTKSSSKSVVAGGAGSSLSTPGASASVSRREHETAERIPGTPETLATSTGGDDDEDEELESPSHSLTSSPADSALHTPPSNADIDGPEQSVNVVGHHTGMAGVSSSIGYGSSGMSIPKVMATGGAPIVVDDVPSITATGANGVAVPLNTKLANGRGVFAEQAIW